MTQTMIRLPDRRLGPTESLEITIERDVVEGYSDFPWITYSYARTGGWIEWTERTLHSITTHRCWYRQVTSVAQDKSGLVIWEPEYVGTPLLIAVKTF